MRGDTKISFCGNNDKEKFRIMFNTSFIQNGNYIVAGKSQLSPEKIKKPKHKAVYHEEMEVYVFFDNFCFNCDPFRTEISDLCPTCNDVIGVEVINQWKKVRQILSEHDYPSV